MASRTLRSTNYIGAISAAVNNFMEYVAYAAPKMVVVYSSILAVTMFFCLGYDDVTTNGSMPMLIEGLQLSQSQTKWVVPLVQGFGVVGAILGGVAADFVGRRRALFIGASLHMAGVIFMSLAPRYAVLLIGRSLMGLGIGAGLTAGPVYLVELAPPSARGFLVAFPQIFINIGSSFGYMALSGVSIKVSNHMAWRVTAGIGVLPSLLLITVGWIAIPETPSWLIRSTQMAATSDVIFRCTRHRVEAGLRLERLTVAEGIHVDELRRIVTIPHRLRPGQLVLGRLLRPAPIGQPVSFLTKVVILHMLQQFSAESQIVDLSRTFLGVSRRRILHHQFRATGVVIVIETIVMLLFSLFFDRFGRRIFCLASIAGIGAFELIFGALALSVPKHRNTSSVLDSVCFTSIIGIVSSFGCGLGPIPWIHNPEWLCFGLRAQGSSIGVAANLMASIITNIMFKPMFKSLPFGYIFIVYAGYMAVGFLATYFLVQETRQRFLNDTNEQDSPLELELEPLVGDSIGEIGDIQPEVVEEHGGIQLEEIQEIQPESEEETDEIIEIR